MKPGILVVDNSRSYLHLVTEELRRENYEVFAAGSGWEALRLLNCQTVDCILMGLCVPDLSGWETCRMIKNRPEWRNIPLGDFDAGGRAKCDGGNAGHRGG